MKRLLAACIIVLFLVVPATAEEQSIDTQMEIVKLQLENVKLKIELITEKFVKFQGIERRLIVELKDLQAQKEAQAKIKEKDTEEEEATFKRG